MAKYFLVFLLCLSATGKSPDKLNTAAQCSYMKQTERDMIREVNYLRSNPAQYANLLQPYLEKAEKALKDNSESRSYAVSTHYETIDGVETVKSDTTWFNINEEEVKAIKSLIQELNGLEPLSILQPDEGIYKAAKSHALDESKHDWELGHRGSDGSWPWNRIARFSPSMADGNENLAGEGGEATPRSIVILLLIDSGIPGYGHRKNLLNPKWTHIACFYGGFAGGMHRWVQNFGAKKK